MQSSTVDVKEVANTVKEDSGPIPSDDPPKESIPTETEASVTTATSTTTLSNANSNNNSSSGNLKRKRSICARCDRPEPSACICEALPDERIHLEKCRCLVLQHPHELRRKNRSLPLVEYCLDDDSLAVTLGRRFGSSTDESVLKMLKEPPSSQEENGTPNPVWLFYPGPDAISLFQALKEHKNSEQDNGRITLLFLDATWKYAKEMDQANKQNNQYPDHMLRVQLSEADLENVTPRRFDIRTPLSDEHLSTAECLAWAVAQVEENQESYDIIMKPLDLMVRQWHSFSDRKKKPKDDSQGSSGNGQHATQSPVDQQTVVEKD
jgi:DTW domain-containing protein YfiP